MSDYFNHTFKSTPPPTILPVTEKTKELYKLWIPIHRKIPRTERFGLGMRCDNAILDLLDLLRKATFTAGDRKIEMLGAVISKVDDIRFLFHLLWETKLISEAQFACLGQNIEVIGRDAGAWKKGMATKTPATRQEKDKV